MQETPRLYRTPAISRPVNGIIVLLLFFVLISYADAACSISGGCGGDSGDWESSAKAFLSSDIPGTFIQGRALGSAAIVGVTEGVSLKNFTVKNHNSTVEINNSAATINSSRAKQNLILPSIRSDKFVHGNLLKPLLAFSSSDLVIDASNGDQYSDRLHIEGAINLLSRRFLYENGTLRSISELAKVLADVGISREESIVIYGDDPSLNDAAFILWVMLYLGQEDAKVLDGNLIDWTSAGLPIESQMNTRKPAKYEPKMRKELLADRDYIISGKAQIVDARGFQEYAKKPIKGLIRIDPTQVLDNGRINDPSQLNETFSKLNASRPVVVYSVDGLDASVVWFALQLSGYDSRLYNWNDKLEQLPPQIAQTNSTSLAAYKTTSTVPSKYKKLGR